jgi:hypothetical protein
VLRTRLGEPGRAVERQKSHADIGYLLASDLRYLRYLLSKNPSSCPLCASVNFFSLRLCVRFSVFYSRLFVRRLPDHAVGLAEADAFAVRLFGGEFVRQVLLRGSQIKLV